jgi:hypothetical protein
VVRRKSGLISARRKLRHAGEMAPLRHSVIQITNTIHRLARLPRHASVAIVPAKSAD